MAESPGGVLFGDRGVVFGDQNAQIDGHIPMEFETDWTDQPL